MKRSIVRLARGLTMAIAFSLPMMAGAQTGKPIIVVLPYDNNSFGKDAADYKGLEKGIADLLITDIAAGNKVRVVERGRLEQIMVEQNLVRTGAVDPETAVRVGKLFGACYGVLGQFMSNGNGTASLTARMVSMETGQVDPNTVKITKKTDDVMGLIDELAKAVDSKLRLTGCPTGSPVPGRGAPSPAATQSGATKAPPPPPAPAAAVRAEDQYAKPLTTAQQKATVESKLDMKTALLYSKGIEALDNKDKIKAAQLFTQVLAVAKDFEPAKIQLAKAKG